MTWNWNFIVSGIIYSALIIMLGNWLLSIMVSKVRIIVPAVPQVWRWRWTLRGYAAIWLLFLIAFGAAGLNRHVPWLIHDDTPWYEARWNYNALGEADIDIQMMLDDNGSTVAAVRKAFSAQQRMPEDFNVIFYGNQSNRLAAYIIVPRHLSPGPYANFLVSVGTNGREFKPMSQLPETVSNLDKMYPPQPSP
jgi:hypothetical protein